MAVSDRDEWLVNLFARDKVCPVLQEAFGSTYCSFRRGEASANCVDMDSKFEELAREAHARGLESLPFTGGQHATPITQRDNYSGWNGAEHVTLKSFSAGAEKRGTVSQRRTSENLFQLRHAASVSICTVRSRLREEPSSKMHAPAKVVSYPCLIRLVPMPDLKGRSRFTCFN